MPYFFLFFCNIAIRVQIIHQVKNCVCLCRQYVIIGATMNCWTVNKENWLTVCHWLKTYHWSKGSGPTIEPCGMPKISQKCYRCCLYRHILSDSLNRSKLVSRLCHLDQKSLICNSQVNMQSNALDKYIKTALIVKLLSNHFLSFSSKCDKTCGVLEYYLIFGK